MTDLLKPRERRGPIGWMAGHTVASNLAMLVCLIGGLLAMWNIKQEVFPDTELDLVQVSVSYPGASPEEVERGILLSVEEAMRGIDGIDEVTAVAYEGSGRVTAEVIVGADIKKVAQDVKGEIDRITTFPEDTEQPRVRIVWNKRSVLTVVLYGQASAKALHALSEQVRDQLTQDPEITQVDISGVPDPEINIEVSQENLRQYGLSLDAIAAVLRNASVDVPGGGLKTKSGEILVRVKERRDYGRQFARLPVVTTPDGSQVLLGQIASIDDGLADTDRYVRYNGQPAVMLIVYRVGDQTPLQVSEAVHKRLEEIEPTLPQGITAKIEHDHADEYRDRLDILLKNGAMGLVLVLVTLGLFLEARLAFWVMMGIPISFLASFMILPAAGVTLNMISLFAYILALGIVVDDAIVVGENVYHYHQQGLGFLSAAVKGTREVAMPVVFSVLTNVVAFIPIYFIPGAMGKTFKMIPVVVCIVFIISLFECLFILPAHLGHQRDRKRSGVSAWLHARQQGFSRWFIHWVNDRYGPFLQFTLRHRYLTISAAVCLLTIMMCYALSGRMGFGLFPKTEDDYSQAEIVMPYGSPVAQTEAVIQRMVDGAQKVLAETGRPELVEAVIADVAREGSHTGRVRVVLARPEVRNKIMSNEEFTSRWRKAVGEVVGAEYLNFASDSGGPGGRGRPVTVELSHRDIGVLERASTDLAETLRTYPTVSDVDDGFQPGKQQLDFAMKPEGLSLGLTAMEVARQVRGAFYGAEVLRQQRGRNEMKIMVRLPEEQRKNEQTVNDLMIRTPAGTYVPLREVANTQRGRAYTTINRRNGRRVVRVSGDVTPRSKGGEVLADLGISALPEMLGKYPGLQYTFEGSQADMRDSMSSLKVSFVLALLAIFAMLAIPFRSYSQPLIVMVSIPFGIVGAFIGHLVMGFDLCIPSIFGIVALSGVVVNDSLVMIDFANIRRRRDGLDHHDAICSAATQRFRPIMLTTLTTFGGLAPMIFETSRAARFLIPMALSLGFGILFATAITLVIVPSLYMAVDDAERVLLPRRH